MKVLNRTDFLKLPAGTIYTKGKPWVFEGFAIKGDTVWDGLDWSYNSPTWVDAESSDVAFERLEEMLQTGASYPCEKDYGRDGSFDDADLFLVFEKADLVWLRSMIDKAIEVSP